MSASSFDACLASTFIVTFTRALDFVHTGSAQAQLCVGAAFLTLFRTSVSRAKRAVAFVDMSIVDVLAPDVHDDEACRRRGAVWFVLASFVPRDIQTFAQTNYEIRNTLQCVAIGAKSCGIVVEGFPQEADPFEF